MSSSSHFHDLEGSIGNIQPDQHLHPSNTLSHILWMFPVFIDNTVVNGQQRPQYAKMSQQSIPPQQLNDRSYYNPSRRKPAISENRASTYNMNRYQNRIIGKHNGCPWRPNSFVYPPGVMGYVDPLIFQMNSLSGNLTDELYFNCLFILYLFHARRLHTEIEQFYAHMIPTRTEHALRVRVVSRIEQVVLRMWPEAHVSYHSFPWHNNNNTQETP